VKSLIMAHNDGDPLWVVPAKMEPGSLPLGERPMPPMQSAMNSGLPKQTLSLREKLPHVKHSPSLTTVSSDE
jgi:hypothetical protein